MTSIEKKIEQKVREAGSSFYWAMRLMEAEKRHSMYAVYAYCREVDDIADGSEPEETKRTKLKEWRNEIERVFKNEPQTEIGMALSASVTRFNLNKSDFLAVIDGMEMDAPSHLQISDILELELYCDRVACAVGRLSNSISGIDPKIGDPLAKSLGLALQLTNILRDVEEDSERKHIYLPQELLDRNNTPERLNSNAVSDTCEELAEMAARQFDEAKSLIAQIDAKSSRPARIMMAVYKKLFDKLCARGWQNLDQPVQLSKPEKAYLVLKTAIS